MPKRAKSICRKAGCNVLIDQPGYCETHKELANPFRELDNKKTSETKKFYSSAAWTRVSKMFRKANPLCEECKSRGIIKEAQLVHHEPDLLELLSKGLNPLSYRYLHGICFNCHQGHLRAKNK